MRDHGGKRSGAGRKAGKPNKMNAEIRAAIAVTGEEPLAYMLRIMRDGEADPERRDRMAIAAATYVHARLSSTEARVSVSTHDEFWSTVQENSKPANGHANGHAKGSAKE